MRYWLLRPNGSGADGPYEPHELRDVPGFGPDRIVAAGGDAWNLAPSERGVQVAWSRRF